MGWVQSLGPPSLPTTKFVQDRKHAVQLDAMMASLGFYATCTIGVMVARLSSTQSVTVQICYGAPAETRQQFLF